MTEGTLSQTSLVVSNERPPTRKEATPNMQGDQTKDQWWKRRNPKNASGSNERPPLKKAATPNMQGAQMIDFRWKKRQPQKCKGLKWKTPDENRGNPKNARGSNERPTMEKEAATKWSMARMTLFYSCYKTWAAHRKSHEGDVTKWKPKNY
jgi:hypothetical protein